MLRVEAVRSIHEPGAVRYIRKYSSGGEILGGGAEKKRERKQRFRAVEKENITVTFCDWVAGLPCKSRNSSCARDVATNAIGSVFPIVKRASDRFPYDVSATEIGPHVRAMRGQHGYFPALRAKCDQAASKNSFRKRPDQIARATEQIPRGWMGREAIDWGRHGGTARLHDILFDAVAHERNQPLYQLGGR